MISYKLFNKISFYNFLKGMAMGVSDLIPGISGGTVALLLGIYNDFINSLKSFNLRSINYLFTLNFKKLSQQLNLPFLIPVLIGISFSIISFSFLVNYLLENFRVALFSFFFGLIFFSSLKIIYNLRPSAFYDFLFIVIGLLVGYFISLINPIGIGEGYFSVFISGLIAITAMLLPGISGSYILLILGKYDYIINSLTNFYLDIILIFLSGAITGVIIFSRVISLLLDRYYRNTVFALSGLMLGALNKMWPWQFDGTNYLPNDFSKSLGIENYMELSILFILISFILSYSLKPIK